MRYRTIVDAMLILVRGGEVLPAERQGTGYADGRWNVTSGHLEQGETIAQAVIREAREEIGITLVPQTCDSSIYATSATPKVTPASACSSRR